MPSSPGRKPRSLSKKKSSGKLLAGKYLDWFNFLAFVAGLTISTCILLVLLSFVMGTLLFPPNGADQPSRSGASEDSQRGLDPIDRTIATAQAKELKEMLVKLATWDRTSSLPIQIDHLRNRIKVADQLLLLQADAETHRYAAESKLMSLSAIYDLAIANDYRNPEIVQQLKSTAEDFRYHSNSELRKHARLLLIAVDLFEFSRDEANDDRVDKLVHQIEKLFEAFPNNPEIGKSLINLLSNAYKLNPRSYEQLVDSLLQSSNKFDHPAEQDFFRELSDERKITNSNLKSLAEKAVQGQPEAREQLATAVKELSTDYSAGGQLLREIVVIANWYEQIGDVATAGEIYQNLIETTPQQLPRLANMAAEFGEKGLQRCSLIGQEIVLQGTYLDGTKLDPKEFQNKNLIILFWTWQESSNLGKLEELYDQLQALNQREFKVLVANVFPDIQPNNQEFVDQFPNFVFVTSDQVDSNLPSLNDQFPATILPRAILVDSSGIVIKTNIPLQSIPVLVNDAIKN